MRLEVVVRLLDLIGSAVPLAILCFILATLLRSRKVDSKLLITYLFIAVLLFIVLLRT